MKKILLHICCAPCGSASVERLLAEEWDVTLYYFMPNIYPKEEWEKRKLYVEKLAKHFGVELIVGEYNHDFWLKNVAGLGQQADLHQQQVPRMTVADVGLFMGHNLTAVLAIVRFGDDDVLHPTERCNVSLLMEIEAGAIVEALQLPPLEQPEEADQGSDVAANQEQDACDIEQKEQVAPMFAQEIAERKGRSKATERVRTTVTEADKPRYVNFDVGISLNNTLADAELDFTIEAPEDIALQNQLAGMTADERTGIAT